MRVIFETEPVRAVQRGMPEIEGWGKFTARVFEPGEEIPVGQHPGPMREWRRTTLRADGTLVTPAPFEGPDPAVVSASVLAAIEDDMLLAIEWELVFDRCIPASEFRRSGSSAESSPDRTR